jgi:hypothetical protein
MERASEQFALRESLGSPISFLFGLFFVRPQKRSGPKLVSFSREETSPARYLKTFYVVIVALSPLDASATARQSCDQRDNEHYQEDEEQELCNPRRCHCDSAKTEYRSDDRDNQKYQRPIKHAAS